MGASSASPSHASKHRGEVLGDGKSGAGKMWVQRRETDTLNALRLFRHSREP